MNEAIFLEQMNRAAVATQSEYDDLTLEVYLEKFSAWPQEDFVAAMQKCSDELNRFPTVGQIRARRPRSHRTAAEVIEHSGLLAFDKKPEQRGPTDLEAEVDNLTNEELEAVIRKYAPYDMDRDMDEQQVVDACRHIAEQFRQMPNSGVYRSYVRDALLKMKQRAGRA